MLNDKFGPPPLGPKLENHIVKILITAQKKDCLTC